LSLVIIVVVLPRGSVGIQGIRIGCASRSVKRTRSSVAARA
jgi:hypothetical protein